MSHSLRGPIDGPGAVAFLCDFQEPITVIIKLLISRLILTRHSDSDNRYILMKHGKIIVAKWLNNRILSGIENDLSR